MKRQVQSPGVRKWFGDDWLNIQNELLAVLEGFFGSYNQQFILSGCEVNGNDISAGIVGLIDGDGFHLCRFAGTQGVVWPLFFYPEKVTENRQYLDLQVKPVTETWQVATNDENAGGYFEIKQDGTSARFTDAIQTVNRRFVTDAEKTNYASQAVTAITTLRNGVSGDLDTLAKIATAIGLLAPKASPALTGTPTAPTAAVATNNTQIATTAFVKAVVDTLTNGAPGVLDTFMEFADAINNDPNFATTITNALALKAPKASPALTGTPTAPTPAAGTNSTQIATTAFVVAYVLEALGNIDNSAITEALAAKLNKNFDNIESVAAAITALGLNDVVRTNDARLINERTPTDTSVTLAKLSAQLKAKVAIAGTSISWQAAAEFTKTLTANTTFTDSGLYEGKVIVIHLTGNFSPSFPAYWDVMKGSQDYDGTVMNKIVAHCINADAGSEEVEYFINQKDV